MDIFESRFQKIRRRFGFFIPVLVLCFFCILFFLGVRMTSQDAREREKSTLENALRSGAVHTYALTGCYPESLNELIEQYQIYYDPDKFIIEYVPTGSNLFPVINVIPLSQGTGGSQ